MRKRHSKAMRATRRHVRREVGIGIRLPAYYDEVAGEVAEQNVVLDLRVLCGTSHAEAHVSVRGSVERVPCGHSAVSNLLRAKENLRRNEARASAIAYLLLCCFGFGFFWHLRAPSSPFCLSIPILLALCPFVWLLSLSFFFLSSISR